MVCRTLTEWQPARRQRAWPQRHNAQGLRRRNGHVAAGSGPAAPAENHQWRRKPGALGDQGSRWRGRTLWRGPTAQCPNPLALSIATSIFPANLPQGRAPAVCERRGGMAEWLKAHAWKACIRATVSWVRIPLPPPYALDFVEFYGVKFR